MEQKTEKMLLSMPSNDMKVVKALVDAGIYPSKSEVVRMALRRFLYSEETEKERDNREKFDEFCKDVQAKIKEKGYTRKDLNRMLEEAKEETRKEVRKMLAEAKRKRK